MEIYRFTQYDKEKEEKYNKYKDNFKEYSDYSQNNCLKKKNLFALNYLKRKKLSEEVIKKVSIGYVPN